MIHPPNERWVARAEVLRRPCRSGREVACWRGCNLELEMDGDAPTARGTP